MSNKKVGKEKIVKLSPPVKWAGGKRKIMDEIERLIPTDFTEYHEWFLGGGSVVLHLLGLGKLTVNQVFCSDVNSQLVNMFNIIKDHVEFLIVELEKQVYKYCSDPNTKRVEFDKHKASFNDLKMRKTVSLTEKVTLAALFIYLNKCGFNGMYRENRSGLYNIPVGKQIGQVKIYDAEHLRNLSEKLKNYNVQFTCEDIAEKVSNLQNVSTGAFVYLDPPYDKTFDGYCKNGFGMQSQELVKTLLDDLTEKKVNVMVSNSATPDVLELYKDYKIHRLTTTKSITCNGKGRNQKFYEVIITNY